ncbi:hypothetical protein LSS_17535 [Leptospira santarosai serovar Shermani str. LT 821]|uniref:Uncharacterized protein n=1 Tax=Leptospira santarosai serovar Shermani str. LT 821 TaxID=758847 RepID=K8Y6M1_9LEPT|nr:hypothetical protein LSS_17535 [Leptospira santarosai serovar Shermani str. LT 821]EPG83477.1 hypothetical protein LEP1GSC048_2581 [Leptospira santarosai serovar Shermani str. 1342KT]
MIPFRSIFRSWIDPAAGMWSARSGRMRPEALAEARNKPGLFDFGRKEPP